jgi:hypothetical protein
MQQEPEEGQEPIDQPSKAGDSVVVIDDPEDDSVVVKDPEEAEEAEAEEGDDAP